MAAIRASPVPSRQIPVKVTTAPISVRPPVSAAISAAMSKVSRCRPTLISASGHRRKEGDLPRTGDGGAGFDMHLIHRRTHDPWVFERIGVGLPPRREPLHQIGDGADLGRKLYLFFTDADPFAQPGKIQDFHAPSSIRCCTPLRK